ncbi:MAG: ATP-binding protein [Candidatus Zixiibacteriota bacterium]
MRKTEEKSGAAKKATVAHSRQDDTLPAADHAEAGLLSDIISRTPVGIIAIDSHCQVVAINSAALEVLDINRDRVSLVSRGTTPTIFCDLLPEKEQSRWQYMINIALSTQEDYSHDRYYHNTGYVEKVISIRMSPLKGVDCGGLVITVEDITDKVLMEKYLVLSEKLAAKGEVASSVARELEEYLRGASRGSEDAEREIEGKKYAKAKDSIQKVTENIVRIRQFVDSLIDFSEPGPDYISYDIKHLIEDLLFSLRMQPGFKKTHFTIEMSQEIPNLEMDVGQIQRVLLNILNNCADAIEEKAVEYQAEGQELKREIEIRASYDKLREKVTVEISDNGVGMTEETMGKIFNMHFSTKKSGHGLGLYHAKRIVKQHRGDLVASSVYSEGTTIALTLPRFQPKKK